MKDKSNKAGFLLILLPLLVPGLLVAGWRCLFRHMAEQKNVFVETVIDFEEMRRLSRDEGWKLNKLFEAVKKNGASSVAISEDTLSSLESEGRITVLSSDEIRKLSLDEGLQQNLPDDFASPGALWVHAQEASLLDRIEQQLSWRISNDKIYRLHRNFLVISKSGQAFKEMVGLGFSTEYFAMAKDTGLGVVARVFNYPGLTLATATKIVNSIPEPAKISALLFADEEMLGNRGELNKIVRLFESRSYRIGWIEFNRQEGINTYLNELSRSRPFVRVHSISRKEIEQIYNRPRAVARWVRAVKGRSMKMLYIRCFFQNKEKYIDDLVQFNLDYLNSIKEALGQAGFKIAENHEQRLNDPRHLLGLISVPELLAMAIALALGFPLLIAFSFKLVAADKWYLITTGIVLVAFIVLSRSLFIALVGLVGAFSYSCLGVILAVQFLKRKGCEMGVLDYVKFFLIMILPTVAGGILIAGLHSEIEYLLNFKQFRGVKLAFILPVIWTFFWSIKETGSDFFKAFKRPLTPLTAIVGLAVFSGLLLYILRSGNLTILKPSALEDSFRTFLETTLVARPRYKEFLVGYPAAVLLIFACFRNWIPLMPVLAIFVQMGQVSVLNTFCHFHSPIILGLLRTVNGLWLGLLVALPVLLFAALFRLFSLAVGKKDKKVVLAGYIGFTNFGDEMLWKVFCRRLIRRLPDFKVALISGNQLEIPSDLIAHLKVVERKNKFQMVENIFSASALIFPGGGIMQSTTSLGSLFYYSLLILLARIAGTKVLMPAQGIGPWGKYIGEYPRLFAFLGRLLHSVEYLSLRDGASGEFLGQIYDQEVAQTADLAFLGATGQANVKSAPEQNLSVAVILRSSVKDSEKIAGIFIQAAGEIENLKIIPVSLQAGDDKVWLNNGWEEEIRFLEDSDEADKIFNNCDLVVSMRLHGCILATLKAIPWIGLAYDPKVSGFARACKWKFCYSPDKIERKMIEDKLNLLAVRKVNYSEKLARIANEFSRKAEADFEAVVSEIDQASS
jgi:polysaccharide pyruvyl transferase CsaB